MIISAIDTDIVLNFHKSIVYEIGKTSYKGVLKDYAKCRFATHQEKLKYFELKKQGFKTVKISDLNIKVKGYEKWRYKAIFPNKNTSKYWGKESVTVSFEMDISLNLKFKAVEHKCKSSNPIDIITYLIGHQTDNEFYKENKAIKREMEILKKLAQARINAEKEIEKYLKK